MTADAFDRITTFLDALRGRLDRRDAGEAAWAASIALSLGTVLGLACALMLGRGAGRSGWIFLTMGVLGAAWCHWRLSWRRRRARAVDATLARWLEQQVPTLRSGVITAVQVRDTLRGATPWPGLCEPLARESAEQTARQLATLRVDALVDRTRLARLTRWALLALLVTTAALLARPDWTLRAANYLVMPPLTVPGGDGELREVDTLVTDLGLTLTFPSYLDRQKRQIPRTGGDFSAITGTRATLTGSVTEPCQQLMLELESDSGSRWPLELDGSGVVHGQLHVGSSDRYRFLAITRSGGFVRERGWRVVDAREDSVPIVRLLLPEHDLEVNPSDKIPMVFEATDDHGLDRIELVIRRKDRRELQRSVVREVGGTRTANGPTTLDVGTVGLVAGESVDVWFEGIDRNTVGEPGRGRSASRRISIFSPEAEHSERLTELDRLIDALIHVLADRLESPVMAGEADRLAEVMQAQLQVSMGASEVIQAFEMLIGAMSTDTLASNAMLTTVREILDGLAAHQELEGAQLRLVTSGVGVRRRPVQILRVLAEHNEEGISLSEVAAWTLKDLLDVARQEQVLAQGRDLLDSQAELMRQIQEMKAEGGKELSPEMQRTLDALEATLARMEEELGNLLERSPYENQNINAEPTDDEQDVRGLRERLAEIRKLMAEGRHDEAMKRLEALQRETQEMMAALQGDFDLQAPREEASRALSEFDLKLGEVTSEQAGLTDETEQEARRLEKEAREALQEQLRKALDKARELALKLETSLDGVDEKSLHRLDKRTLGELETRAQQTREAVERLERQVAQEQAREVAKRSGGLATEVGESEARELNATRRDALRESIARLTEAETLAKELVAELDKTPPKAPKPSMDRRKQSSRLEKRQQRIGRAMSELEQQMKGVEETLPGIGETLRPTLDEAREAMKQAEGELGEVRPGPAEGHQRRAMDRLGAMKQAIEKRLRDPQGKRSSGSGINRRTQRIEIPNADDHRSPKAFREELLKAMKERAPERYEDAIDRYYEELVR